MEYQVYPPSDGQKEASAAPLPPADDNFWITLMDALYQFPAELGTPSSPSEMQDDHLYTPVTPLATSPAFDGPLFALPLDFNPAIDMPPFLLPPSSIAHDELSVYIPAHHQAPTIPPSSLPSLVEHGPSPHVAPSQLPLRNLGAKRPRKRKAATPWMYQCDVDGCTVSFTSSRRDIERHKASVHGPPIVLECGESLSYRPDNIARHRRKCQACSLAHKLKCEEEGESRPRPGRKRKIRPDPKPSRSCDESDPTGENRLPVAMNDDPEQ